MGLLPLGFPPKCLSLNALRCLSRFLGQSLYQIESHKVDLFDEDLEDDDVELYTQMDISDQIQVMKIRQTLQTSILNK
jgi:hypothetical protein